MVIKRGLTGEKKGAEIALRTPRSLSSDEKDYFFAGAAGAAEQQAQGWSCGCLGLLVRGFLVGSGLLVSSLLVGSGLSSAAFLSAAAFLSQPSFGSGLLVSSLLVGSGLLVSSLLVGSGLLVIFRPSCRRRLCVCSLRFLLLSLRRISRCRGSCGFLLCAARLQLRTW